MVYYVCTFIFKQFVFREPIREPRRVGSGRLMSRDSWDSVYRQPENGISSNFNFGKGNFREASHSSMLVLNIYNSFVFDILLLLFIVIYFREPRRKDFEFDRGELDRFRNYDRFKSSSNFDRRRNDSYRTQEEPEWMTGNCYFLLNHFPIIKCAY